jgi:hypothetical protein
MKNKRIFLKFEKIAESEIKLELSFERDEEKNIYIMGFASTPEKNSYGYIVENSALLECWKNTQSEGKNIAVYEKHDMPSGKVVACEEINGKILVVMEIPKAGNERLISVYEQGIYVGLSIGGWATDAYEDDEKISHVTKMEWYEVSLTDIPSNENALLLEDINAKRPIKKENKIESVALEKTLQQVIDRIKGN